MQECSVEIIGKFKFQVIEYGNVPLNVTDCALEGLVFLNHGLFTLGETIT